MSIALSIDVIQAGTLFKYLTGLLGLVVFLVLEKNALTTHQLFLFSQ